MRAIAQNLKNSRGEQAQRFRGAGFISPPTVPSVSSSAEERTWNDPYLRRYLMSRISVRLERDELRALMQGTILEFDFRCAEHIALRLFEELSVERSRHCIGTDLSAKKHHDLQFLAEQLEVLSYGVLTRLQAYTRVKAWFLGDLGNPLRGEFTQELLRRPDTPWRWLRAFPALGGYRPLFAVPRAAMQGLTQRLDAVYRTAETNLAIFHRQDLVWVSTPSHRSTRDELATFALILSQYTTERAAAVLTRLKRWIVLLDYQQFEHVMAMLQFQIVASVSEDIDLAQTQRQSGFF